MLAAALFVAIGLATGGCELMPASPGAPDASAITPSDVLANPESFLGKSLEISGRLHVEKYETLEPCGPDSPAPCAGPTRTTLHLVTAGEPRRNGNTLDLYRSTRDGGEEPVVCRVISAAEFDCGSFKPESVSVVNGRLIKHRIPIQQVGYPDGRMVVLQYREIYVLLVQP